MLKFVEIELLFPLQEAMCSYNKTQVSPYDPTKLAFHSILRPEDDHISNSGQNFKKTVSFVDIVHFIDEDDIVTYEDFDCGFTFYHETPTKIRETNRERNYISRSCENSKCILSNDRHKCFIDEQHYSNIFWTRTIYGTWFQQLLCHSITLMIDTLFPISTLNQQLTNLEQTISGVLFLTEDGQSKEGIVRQLCILSAKLPTRRTTQRNSCYGWRVEWPLETRSDGWKSTVCDEL